MAHNVEATDSGIARHGAWHNLWTVTSEFLTASEALAQAGLDWLVNLVSLFVSNPSTGEMMEVPGVKATQRSDTGTVFGTVTPGYAPLQNHTLAEAIENIFGAGAKVVEAAFSLFGGRKVVFLVNLGAAKIELALAGKTVEDPHVSYLMFSTMHDGKGGWSILPTPVRTICGNTVRAAEGENGEILARDGITIRHSSKADQRIADATEAYRKAIEAGRLTLDRVQKVARKRVTKSAKTAYYRTVVDATLAPVTEADRKAAEGDAEKIKAIERRERRREELYAAFQKWEAIEASTYTDGAQETDNAYLIYNAVSDAFEHDSHFRKSDGATATENEFVSRVYGKVSDQKDEALLLMEEVVRESSNLLDMILDRAEGPEGLLDKILAEV